MSDTYTGICCICGFETDCIQGICLDCSEKRNKAVTDLEKSISELKGKKDGNESQQAEINNNPD